MNVEFMITPEGWFWQVLEEEGESSPPAGPFRDIYKAAESFAYSTEQNELARLAERRAYR